MILRALLLVPLLGFLSVSMAQEPGDVRFGATDGSANLSYQGDTNRVSLGVDDDGDFYGEFLHVFGEQDDSNWIGEGWLGQDGQGGVKVSYHWLPGSLTAQDLLDKNDLPGVRKLFLAADQNMFDDRKISLGFGYERKETFWAGYLTRAISGEREIGSASSIFTDQIEGTQEGRPFVQDRTVETIRTFFAHPYDYGLGFRVGRYIAGPLLRVRGGLDLEKGDFGSDQTTLTVGLEKFFDNSGHSLRLDLEHAEKDGDFETDESDTRAFLFWRYQFGGRKNFAPAINYRERAFAETLVSSAPKGQSAEGDMQLIRNRITVADTVLYEFDQAELTALAIADLREIAGKISELDVVSSISVSGHTCDIGTEAYNLSLSHRRAKSVEAFLTGENGLSIRVDTRGVGEAEPRFPNTSEENRRRNRRTEIEFVTLESRPPTLNEAVDAEPKTGVRWEREPVNDPAWVKRALRNPVQHKRTVDYYRYETQRSVETLGPVVFLNSAPTATDDQYTVSQNSVGNVLDVLSNDGDADEDALTIVSVSAASNGAVAVSGGALTYTPSQGFAGEETFTYVVSDGEETASAMVTIQVVNGPPTAVDDVLVATPGITNRLDVLANDVDPDGDELRIVAVSSPMSGTAFVDGDRIGYTPPGGFSGTDTFTYTIADTAGNESTATVTVDVSNGAPIAVDDVGSTAKDTPVVLDVLANDSDPDGDSLSVVSVVPQITEFGQVEIQSDGTVLYTPNPGWWGGDSFEYTVSDPFGATDTARVELTVTQF